MRKDIIELFKSNGFHIEVITGLISVDFLDINLNLRNNTYLPYKKPNDSMLYVHTSSNHPRRSLSSYQ